MLIYKRFQKTERIHKQDPAPVETPKRGTKRTSDSKEKSSPRSTKSRSAFDSTAIDDQAKADAAAKLDHGAIDELQGDASPRKKQKRPRS
jgi:hypothetical protein